MAYCFGGQTGVTEEGPVYTSSIEKIDIDFNNHWTLLTLNLPQKAYHIVGVPLQRGILVFGGTEDKQTEYQMYLINLDGVMTQELSNIKNIPGFMGGGSVILQNDMLYAVGSREQWKMQKRPMMFDGNKWRRIA